MTASVFLEDTVICIHEKYGPAFLYTPIREDGTVSRAADRLPWETYKSCPFAVSSDIKIRNRNVVGFVLFKLSMMNLINKKSFKTRDNAFIITKAKSTLLNKVFKDIDRGNICLLTQEDWLNYYVLRGISYHIFCIFNI